MAGLGIRGRWPKSGPEMFIIRGVLASSTPRSKESEKDE